MEQGKNQRISREEFIRALKAVSASPAPEAGLRVGGWRAPMHPPPPTTAPSPDPAPTISHITYKARLEYVA